MGRPRNTPEQQLTAATRHAKKMSDWHRADYAATRSKRRRVGEDPEKVRARSRVRRARKRGSNEHFTTDQFLALGNRCLCCGHTKEELAYEGLMLVPDHVLALVNGGSDDIGNIQPLCHRYKSGTIEGCNNVKGATHIDYRGNYGKTEHTTGTIGYSGSILTESTAEAR
jgi:hypothetical protein